MRPFTYNGLPARVVFGSGTVARLPHEAERLGLNRALVLATPQQEADAERLAAALGGCSAGVFAGATMHTPVEVTERAIKVAIERGADGLVAIGGGSTTGLGKAIALRTDLPQIVLPTTYAGSEMTAIIGETSAGEKVTQRNMKVLPEVVIYDVDLTLTLPVGLSVTSAINAIAHAAEALYAQESNPILDLFAEEGVAAFARALPVIHGDPQNPEARSDALYGAWLCGICLGQGGTALHHKLCHVLGGTFDLPHAETHTVVLPHALAFNAPAAPQAMARLRRAVGGEEPAAAIYDLARKLGAPTSLRELGMPEEGIDQATEVAMKNPYWNPRPLTKAGIREVIAAAWLGERPKV